MRIIVQKFGGTSVGDEEARLKARDRVISARQQGFDPVVVVSAMGRRPSPYATDSLLDLVRGRGLPVDARALDLLASCGEIISSVVMAGHLRAAGLEAVPLTGAQAGIRTDAEFGDASIQGINTARLLDVLASGQIPVVAGFQGVTDDGETTTLGRGGSDTTATALGVALRAECVEIYTDVEGVMTVDPKIVPDARLISAITYFEVEELANNGAKVVHPRAVHIAQQGGIPVRVRSTFAESEGTFITDEVERRVITGIAHVDGLARVEALYPNPAEPSRARVAILKAISTIGINVDFINVTPRAILFTVKDEFARAAEEALRSEGYACHVMAECAKVSVVGAGMQEVPGVMARVVESLHRAGVHIMQTVDSEITISCLIDQASVARAVRALYDEFDLGSPGSS
ncbi:MAG: aspartate kinase [Firmicutes bacterium]|nr:aspartate kinase [Bacillota bacterium]MDH7495127.1 aspartate kinase [Bacillota bacterium]